MISRNLKRIDVLSHSRRVIKEMHLHLSLKEDNNPVIVLDQGFVNSTLSSSDVKKQTTNYVKVL